MKVDPLPKARHIHTTAGKHCLPLTTNTWAPVSFTRRETVDHIHTIATLNMFTVQWATRLLT